MASNIGIKIANGEFYPLVEENSLIKKRLVLTTVHDNQPSVQVDLYRSPTNAMSDAQYIGSLVVDNIQSKGKGEPSIEMVISSNDNGEIVADALDLDMGADAEHHVLTVSLKSLDETARDMEIPDFELETNEEPPASLYNKAEKIRKEKSRNYFPLILVLIILLLLGLAAWILFFGGKDVFNKIIPGRSEQTQTQTQTQPLQPAQTSDIVSVSAPASEPSSAQVSTEPVSTPAPEPLKPADPPPVIAALEEPPAPRPQNTSRTRSAPVHSYNVPATIPREGVNYTIRWGDTLWDISEAFYRTPWLYPRIAQHNNIRNPDRIISGRTIKIPPRN